MRILGGDVGGTNTRFGIYDRERGDLVVLRTYPSALHPTFERVVDTFVEDARRELGTAGPICERACIGVAGPIENGTCKATNLPWRVESRAVAQRLGLERVELVDDFVAMATAVPWLSPAEVVPVGGGAPVEHGPIAVLGPGTGLGEAFLVWQERSERYRVLASEGGHADFAPRTPLESGLMEFLTTKYGRVSNERVLSGNGLVDAFLFLSEEPAFRSLVLPSTRAAMAGGMPAAVVSGRGMSGEDPVCAVALSLFAAVLGSVAGNLALTLLARGGVYVGGGIAPRIVDFLAGSGMRHAFEDKGRLRPMLERIPLFVIVREHVGLLGAVHCALEHEEPDARVARR